MRVIAGTLRGQRLAAPLGRGTRPMTDRVRETIFNILGHRFGTLANIPPVDVLDLFAGSGGLGIEALSRGARHCTFVERDRSAARTLRENIAHLKLEPACTIRSDNVWSMRPPRTPDGFGLIFLDPPYRDVEPHVRMVDLIERLAPALRPDGLLLFRLETRTAFDPRDLRGLTWVDERIIARMRLLLLAHPSEQAPTIDATAE